MAKSKIKSEEEKPPEQKEERKLDKLTIFCYYLICFFILAIAGWIIEVTESFLRLGIFVNRGFLFGPFVPIYAFGSLLIYFALRRLLKDKIIVQLMKNKTKVGSINITPLLVFISVVVLTTVLEYFVSWFLELVFDRTWWYYGYEVFHLHGRIMLRTSLLFGVAGLFYLYLAEPVIRNILLRLKNIQIRYLSIILIGLFAIDTIISIILHWINR
ncbi:MAG: putative ABC transporter permease [Oscillospiraceae bacterium]|nr:putative ABC transporter permease [Oscillospiraceae bacterium]